ncbi:MAG: DMT family transporter [Candidatus Micrarchaeota archaeon]|nr:DMT family transporter [Candidatus Micrarchaeota archaeon]
MLSLPIMAAISTVFFYIAAAFLAKKVSAGLGSMLTSAIVITFGVVPMLIALFVIGNYSVPQTYIVMAAVSGIPMAAGYVLLYRSLQTEQLTNSIALTEISPALTVLFGIAVLGESLTETDAISIAVIFLGALLIITTTGLKINRRLIPAALSSVLWACYWIILAYVLSYTSNFTEIVAISRLTSIMFVFAYFLAIGNPIKSKVAELNKTRKGMAALKTMAILAVFMGIFDGSGDILFSYVFSSKIVAIGGAISALAPMAVSVLGYFFYKDRLTPMQFIGLITMVAGAVALSIA